MEKNVSRPAPSAQPDFGPPQHPDRVSGRRMEERECDARDACSLEGASRMAEAIRGYWAVRGIAADVRTTRFRDEESGGDVFGVVSDLKFRAPTMREIDLLRREEKAGRRRSASARAKRGTP